MGPWEMGAGEHGAETTPGSAPQPHSVWCEEAAASLLPAAETAAFPSGPRAPANPITPAPPKPPANPIPQPPRFPSVPPTPRFRRRLPRHQEWGQRTDPCTAHSRACHGALLWLGGEIHNSGVQALWGARVPSRWWQGTAWLWGSMFPGDPRPYRRGPRCFPTANPFCTTTQSHFGNGAGGASDPTRCGLQMAGAPAS